jgi:hypothetical protein
MFNEEAGELSVGLCVVSLPQSFFAIAKSDCSAELQLSKAAHNKRSVKPSAVGSIQDTEVFLLRVKSDGVYGDAVVTVFRGEATEGGEQ